MLREAFGRKKATTHHDILQKNTTLQAFKLKLQVSLIMALLSVRIHRFQRFDESIYTIAEHVVNACENIANANLEEIDVKGEHGEALEEIYYPSDDGHENFERQIQGGQATDREPCSSAEVAG